MVLDLHDWGLMSNLLSCLSEDRIGIQFAAHKDAGDREALFDDGWHVDGM